MRTITPSALPLRKTSVPSQKEGGNMHDERNEKKRQRDTGVREEPLERAAATKLQGNLAQYPTEALQGIETFAVETGSPSSATTSTFCSGKSFWMKFLDEFPYRDHEPSVSKATPTGQEIRYMWSSGSPLSESSAFDDAESTSPLSGLNSSRDVPSLRRRENQVERISRNDENSGHRRASSVSLRDHPSPLVVPRRNVHTPESVTAGKLTPRTFGDVTNRIDHCSPSPAPNSQTRAKSKVAELVENFQKEPASTRSSSLTPSQVKAPDSITGAKAEQDKLKVPTTSLKVMTSSTPIPNSSNARLAESPVPDPVIEMGGWIQTPGSQASFFSDASEQKLTPQMNHSQKQEKPDPDLAAQEDPRTGRTQPPTRSAPRAAGVSIPARTPLQNANKPDFSGHQSLAQPSLTSVKDTSSSASRSVPNPMKVAHDGRRNTIKNGSRRNVHIERTPPTAKHTASTFNSPAPTLTQQPVLNISVPTRSQYGGSKNVQTHHPVPSVKEIASVFSSSVSSLKAMPLKETVANVPTDQLQKAPKQQPSPGVKQIKAVFSASVPIPDQPPKDDQTNITQQEGRFDVESQRPARGVKEIASAFNAVLTEDKETSIQKAGTRNPLTEQPKHAVKLSDVANRGTGLIPTQLPIVNQESLLQREGPQNMETKKPSQGVKEIAAVFSAQAPPPQTRRPQDNKKGWEGERSESTSAPLALALTPEQLSSLRKDLKTHEDSHKVQTLETQPPSHHFKEIASVYRALVPTPSQPQDVDQEVHGFNSSVSTSSLAATRSSTEDTEAKESRKIKDKREELPFTALVRAPASQVATTNRSLINPDTCVPPSTLTLENQGEASNQELAVDSVKHSQLICRTPSPTASGNHSAPSSDASNSGFKQLLKQWRDQSDDKPNAHFLSPEQETKSTEILGPRNTGQPLALQYPLIEGDSNCSKTKTPIIVKRIQAFDKDHFDVVRTSVASATSQSKKVQGGDPASYKKSHFQRCDDADSPPQVPKVNSLLGNPKLGLAAYCQAVTGSSYREEDVSKNEDTSQAIVVLKKNNDVHVLVGEATSETSDGVVVRNAELISSDQKASYEREPLPCGCSRSIFSGNDDFISFFLPKMGMACTCGRQSKGFVVPEDPTAIENILRPWQVEFLKSFGIHRGDQLVKARHRSGTLLAKALRQWRRKKGMVPFRTSSCGMALQIWAKTCKAFVRSIRKHMEAGDELLLDQEPAELVQEFSNFLGALPAAPEKQGESHFLAIEPDSQVEV